MYIVLFHQVPLKFRYPFLPHMMWYAADKYVRLLEKDKKERGLISKPKKDKRKQDTATPKKKDTVFAKGKASNKRPAKTDGEGKEEETRTSAEKELVEEDAGAPNRRRSSRVAKNEAIARQAQENEEKEKTVKKEEEREGVNKKKRSPKKTKDREEINGEHHEENDENENTPEANEQQEENAPWRPVYLTRFEVEGLNKLIEKLRKWPQAQKNVPSSVEDPDGLLERLEVCVF